MNSQHGISQRRDPLGSMGTSTIYSLVTRNRTPKLAPGKPVEIEVFLSGHGIPIKNKLQITWSSPYIVDKGNPGNLRYCIKCFTDPKTGLEHCLTGSRYIDGWGLTLTDLTVTLNRGFFLEVVAVPAERETGPKDKEVKFPEFGIKPVASEKTFDGNPPLLLVLNTTQDAPSGNYDVTFVFTYGNDQKLQQDYRTVPFHITSWWERNQGWVAILGTAVALGSLLASAIS